MMNQARIQSFPFDQATLSKIQQHKWGTNWPVVYILETSKIAYVGETTSAIRRMKDHLKNPERDVFDNAYLIHDETFNKSATLDIESRLIEYIWADAKYDLQNNNRGLRNHNYYEKKRYDKLFQDIWAELRDLKIAKNSIRDIENSDLFKFSPYKTLTEDQVTIVEDLEKTFLTQPKSLSIIKGEPGSGKTVLAVYLAKYLMSDEKTDKMRIGIVLPQTALRETIKKIFRKIGGLKASMVLGPNDVVNVEGEFDLLIVDEAHRLTQRQNLASYAMFDEPCKKLGLDPKSSSQLDWIMKRGKHVVLFYDEKQSVKPSDVDPESFARLAGGAAQYRLTSQMRVLAGNQYSEYIDYVFRQRQTVRMNFDGYDFKLFTDVGDMVGTIALRESECGLSRMVAGYAWEWASKNNKNAFDIDIGGVKLRWNSITKDWINSPGAHNEVGCIHTVQGYDLNYTGVIIGPEMTYEQGSIVFHPERYKDKHGKLSSHSQAKTLNYIINIYKTLMTRGIKGTYVYACDEGLQDYLMGFIPVERNPNFNNVGQVAAEDEPEYGK